MSNARKLSKLIVGTEFKVSSVDSEISNKFTSFNTRLDSDDTAIQAARTLIQVNSAGSAMKDSDLKVVADLRNDLDSEILSVRSMNLSYTNFLYNASANQTAFTGSDANGATLDYKVGSIQVFLNGILLVDTVDYTATDGSNITLTQPADVNHQISILAPVVKKNYTAPTPPPDWGGMKLWMAAEKVGPVLGSNDAYGISGAISPDGLYAAAGNYRGRGLTAGGSHEPSIYANYGGYHIYKNSGDETDNTQWDLCVQIGRLPTLTGGPTGAEFDIGAHYNNMYIGGNPIYLSSGAEKIIFPFTSTSFNLVSPNDKKTALFVLAKNDSEYSYDSDVNDYASFNPYLISADRGTVSGTAGNAMKSDLAKKFDVSDDCDRIAYYMPRYTSASQGGAVIIVKRTGTTFAVEQQINHDQLRSGFATSNAKMGASNVVMDAAGEKVVASSRDLSSTSENGGFATFTRSGTTWSIPNGGTKYGTTSDGGPGGQCEFGRHIHMSRDGNYLAATAYHTNSADYTNKHWVRIYLWNSGSNSWVKQQDIVIRNDNCGIEYIFTDRIDGVRLNKEGNVLMVRSSQDDDSDNLQANTSVIRFYKREGTTWSGLSHKTGHELWSQGTDVPSNNYTGGPLTSFSTSFGSQHHLMWIDLSDSGRTAITGTSGIQIDKLYGTGSMNGGAIAIMHDS